MTFLGRISSSLTINGAHVGDLVVVFIMLFIMEFSNRLILGSLGDTPEVYTTRGLLYLLVNLLQGMISGGPVDPAINKLRSTGIVSHETAMHIYQLSGLSMLFGLTATFGFQKLHGILLGTQFALATSVYLICTVIGNVKPAMKRMLRKAVLCCKKTNKAPPSPSSIEEMEKILKNNQPDLLVESPIYWCDEVLYYIVVDRFNRVDQKRVPLPADKNVSGHIRHGGNIKGITDKVAYLAELGVTAIILSPIQTNTPPVSAYHEPYHGYCAVNFFEVDPHFGTMSDFQTLVRTCHDRNIKVILDISLNHMGPLFDYQGDDDWNDEVDDTKAIRGWKYPPIPSDLQAVEHFSRRGIITDWSDKLQLLNGDFPPFHRRLATENLSTQNILIKVLFFWMREGDIDGFRIDAVKHIAPAFVERLGNELKAYAANKLGKQNFLLLAENSSGIDEEIKPCLTTFGCAYNYPDYRRVNFALHGHAASRELETSFRISLGCIGKDSHDLVRFVDNHDVYRFLRSNEPISVLECGLSYLLLSMGIPLLYYGTEQAFSQDVESLDPESAACPADPGNRASMFLPEPIDPMKPSQNKCFDRSHHVYIFAKKLIATRNKFAALRRGKQVIRWSNPSSPGIFAFSRIYDGCEVVVAINTSEYEQSANFLVDAALTPPYCLLVDALEVSYKISTRPCVRPSSTGQFLSPETSEIVVSLPPRGRHGVRILVKASNLP